jgi:hypothetical protein
VKIYAAAAAAMEALRKKERVDETQFTAKICGKTSLGSSYFSFVKFHYAFDGPPPLFMLLNKWHLFGWNVCWIYMLPFFKTNVNKYK